MTVNLTAGQDGFFVLNTQGAYENRLHLAADLSLGDLPLPADVVRVFRNGVEIDPSRYSVDYATDTIGLFDSYDVGDVITVTAVRHSLTSYIADGGADYDVTGARVTAFVNGLPASGELSGGVFVFDAAPDVGAYITFHVETDATVETFKVPATTLDSDKDTVNGHNSTLPLVIFGGQDDDVLHGGTGGDIVFGDRGLVVYGNGLGVLANGGPGDVISDGTLLPVTLITSRDTTVGGSDTITTGLGAPDRVIGGVDGDTITTNRGGGFTTADGNVIVFGDNGLIDYTSADGDPSDIDRVWTIDPDTGGSDTITTGAGDDIVIAGEDGEKVIEIGPQATVAQTVEAHLADGDVVSAGDGNNIVFGDNGRITAAVSDLSRFGSIGITLGLVEAIESLIGGSDTITTGVGRDVVIGGIDADTIVANSGETALRPDSNNIVFGDSGLIDWTATERGGALAGDDSNPADIDRLWSLAPDHGGSDHITTGNADDIVIAGEDGELVVDVAIDGVVTTPRSTIADTTRGDGDVVVAGNGFNIVLGDSGQLTAGVVGAPQMGTLPITLLEITTTMAPGLGGSDTITTGNGRDIVVAGTLNDIVDAGAENDIVLGDNGRITYFTAAGETNGGIKRIETTDLNIGGLDKIYGRDGQDILIGGGYRDDIDGGYNDDLIFGDQVALDRRPGVITNPRFRELVLAQIYTRTDLHNAIVAAADFIYDNSGALLIQPDWEHVPRPRRRVPVLLDRVRGQAAVARPGDPGRPDPLAGPKSASAATTSPAAAATTRSSASSATTRSRATATSTAASAATRSARRARRRPTRIGDADRSARRARRPTDGDDYIEGGGGADVIFGGLGQDDIVGGSSDLFTLDTADKRPDGADYIFGGAGDTTLRAASEPASVNHGRDADAIVGDNGRIIRLVGGRPGAALPDFNLRQRLRRASSWSAGSRCWTTCRAARTSVPTATRRRRRRAAWPTRPAAAAPTRSTARTATTGSTAAAATTACSATARTTTSSAAGATTGSPAAPARTASSATTGASSRAATALTEPLYGVTTANAQTNIASPGNAQTATIFPTGQLNKAFDITPFNLRPNALGGRRPAVRPAYADDVIFGGLGSDFLHGGSGDDAISGAEALAESYARPLQRPTRSSGSCAATSRRPFNTGDMLHFVNVATSQSSHAGQFPFYDEFDPLRAILLEDDGTLSKDATFKLFLLNWNKGEGPQQATGIGTDGDDIIFGDVGNDWLVGGTGQDTMWGGWGNDMLDADDDKRGSRAAASTTASPRRSRATSTARSAAPASTS